MHFISGLPRSGSTLLSAILKQNPRFNAGITSPIPALINCTQQQMSGNEFSVFFDDIKRENIFKGIFESYYKDSNTDVIFDTNRVWTGRASLLNVLYPNSKIICCVRELNWILDSFERIHNKNPLQLSSVFGYNQTTSIYSRVELMMNSESGIIGAPWSTLNEAWFGEFANKLILVPYDNLVKNPKNTINKLYQCLGEPEFEHDFDNVSYSEHEFDKHIGLLGLHDVGKKVKFVERNPIIPLDLFDKYSTSKFWNTPELNPKSVIVL